VFENILAIALIRSDKVGSLFLSGGGRQWFYDEFIIEGSSEEDLWLGLPSINQDKQKYHKTVTSIKNKILSPTPRQI